MYIIILHIDVLINHPCAPLILIPKNLGVQLNWKRKIFRRTADHLVNYNRARKKAFRRPQFIVLGEAITPSKSPGGRLSQFKVQRLSWPRVCRLGVAQMYRDANRGLISPVRKPSRYTVPSSHSDPNDAVRATEQDDKGGRDANAGMCPRQESLAPGRHRLQHSFRPGLSPPAIHPLTFHFSTLCLSHFFCTRKFRTREKERVHCR